MFMRGKKGPTVCKWNFNKLFGANKITSREQLFVESREFVKFGHMFKKLILCPHSSTFLEYTEAMTF